MGAAARRVAGQRSGAASGFVVAPSTAPSGDATAGTDDGTKLTLWTRAPLEKQAKLLVAAYNASHKNQVALTVVPNDDYVAKVGAAAGAKGLPDLFAADIVYVPNWVKQGLFQDLTVADQRPAVQGPDQQGPPDRRHLPDGKEYVLPFVLDLSMLFWNKDLFKEAGLDPDKAPATIAEYANDAKAVQALQQARRLRHGDRPELRRLPGLHLVPQHLGLRRPGDEPRGHRSRCSTAPTPKKHLHTWHDLWKSGAVLPCSKDEAGPTWTAGFTAGKVGLMSYPATLLSSTTGFDVGVAGHPRRQRAVPRPSSAATASASRRTPRRPPRPGTSCPG